ncbi:hypothetical protein [Haladaptatus sp. DFWS20]|uniref:hypothetical protein n=1 Tax=Haladaptatus sp. DFWS20 TaxID=3403467 RepID=UPI003EB79A4C
MSKRGKRAIAISAGISILYSGIVFRYSVYLSSNISISGPAWQGFALYSVLAFGTVGIPLLLWIRYEIRSPGVLLALILLFWHVLVEFPPIRDGQGDSPGFLFVFIWVPFYLVACGVFAAAEYWLRGRDFSVSLPSE